MKQGKEANVMEYSLDDPVSCRVASLRHARLIVRATLTAERLSFL